MAPNGIDLYVGYIRSGDVMKITGATTTTSGSPTVSQIGATSDGRGSKPEVAVVATQPGAQYDIGSARLVLPGLAKDPALYDGVYAYISGAASPTQATAAVAAALLSPPPVPSGSTNGAAQKMTAARSPSVVSVSARGEASDVQEPPPPFVLTAPVMSRDYVTKEQLAEAYSHEHLEHTAGLSARP